MAGRAGPLQESLTRDARHAMMLAALVAVVIGFLGLWASGVALKERNHFDLEILVGATDSVVVVTLGVFGLRHRGVALLALSMLAVAGIAYQRWDGAPWQASAVNVVTAVVYVRGWRAARTLRSLDGRGASPAA